MSKPKHTPGPWRKTFGRTYEIESEGKSICSVYGADEAHQEWTDEGIANARLISAAPALLEQCNNALSYINGCRAQSGNVDHELTDLAVGLNEAIKKARGEE